MMQIMSGVQPDTFINALLSKKNSAIGRQFLEAHGNNNFLKKKTIHSFKKVPELIATFSI